MVTLHRSFESRLQDRCSHTKLALLMILLNNGILSFANEVNKTILKNSEKCKNTSYNFRSIILPQNPNGPTNPINKDRKAEIRRPMNPPITIRNLFKSYFDRMTYQLLFPLLRLAILKCLEITKEALNMLYQC